MVELSARKESVVSSLANAEAKIRNLRDHLMKAAFRSLDVSDKEKVLSKAEEVLSLLKPGLDKSLEIVASAKTKEADSEA